MSLGVFRQLTLFALLALTPQAYAGPKIVAVASGDCRSPELLRGMATFQTALENHWRSELYDPEVILDLTRSRPTRTPEELQRMVETAKTLFYSGQGDRAMDLTKQAISDLERVPPDPRTWALLAEAWIVRAQALRAAERKNESAEAFRQVLRVDPQFQLDPDFFTPSTLQQFELLRKDLLKGRKTTLVVQSTPPGADVYIDGRNFGRTPLKTDLLPGSYRVVLQSPDQRSFPHLVNIPKEAALQIDLSFEGAVASQAPLCLSGFAPNENAAHKLASLVGAERVVVFWNERGGAQQPFFKALVSQVGGAREREAGVDGKQLDELASFIATGQPALSGALNTLKTSQAPAVPKPEAQTNPLVIQPAPEAPPAVAAPAKEVSAPPPTAEPAATPVASVTTADPARSTGVRASTVVGLSLIAAAVGLGVAGAVVFATGATERDRLATLTANGKLPAVADATHAEALKLTTGVSTTRTVAFTLFGASAGALVSSIFTFILFRNAPASPSSPSLTSPSLTVVPLSDGVGVSAQSTW